MSTSRRPRRRSAPGAGRRSAGSFCRRSCRALLDRLALAFARGLGEYGSVIFIAGNMPMVSEIVPLLIVIELEQYDYAGATVVGTAMLAASFLLLLAINLLQRWRARARADAEDALMLASAGVYQVRVVTADRPLVRAVLIATALAFLVVFLLLPLLAVFVEALRQGLGAYLAGITEADALAAIRLTCWSRRSPCRSTSSSASSRMGDRQVRVRRQEPADHADRPAVLGLAGDRRPDLRPPVRRPGLLGPWLAAHDIKIIFAVPGIVLATIFVTFRSSRAS